MTLLRLPIEFAGSFPDPLQPLSPPLPEIAFVGRSNVGKSSLLNSLVGQKQLARVSATPGKTQLMNVFRLPNCYLIDLPGYGFAKASKTARAAYRVLLDGVLEKRPTLSGVVWLLDARHPPSADDAEIKAVLAAAGRPVLAVLTKSDKLKRSELLKAVKDRASELEMAPDELLVTSGKTQLGMDELAESILALVSDARTLRR